MNQPLLSIVIPTRNRQFYCIKAIENILSYKNDNFELCIQDNSDNNDIENYIQEFISDCRLVYKYVATPLASIFNINDAIDLAHGKYVLLIGDDDTILPNIFEVISWVDNMGYDSVCPMNFVSFFWPGARDNKDGGLVDIPQYRNKTKFIDVSANLANLFRDGIINYMSYNLPKIYHGIILRERLLEVKNKIGKYFQGLSPDISACVSLSTVVKNHVVLEFPITIAGACRMSSTSQSYNHGHKGKLEDAPHFHLRGTYHWNDCVPRFYSVETIWADSALNTALFLQRYDLVSLFCYERLSAYALLRNREILFYALKKIFVSSPYYKSILPIKLFPYLLYFSMNILWKKISKKKNVQHFLKECGDISEAVRIFSEYALKK